MILTAGYCAGRMLAARRWRRPTEFDVDLLHTVMGVAMAGMLVPRLNPLRYGSWEVVFAAAMGWFGGQIIAAYRGRPAHAQLWPDGHRPADARSSHWHRASHHAPHLLACGAMLYMYLVAGVHRTGTWPPAMSASGPPASITHSPGLALPLAVALLSYVIWTTDRLTALPPVAALAGAPRTGTPPSAAGLTGRGLNGADLGLTDDAVSREADGPPGRARPPDRARPPMSPRLAACCEIAMGVTMGYMLIQLL
jgi:hypothetical protein